MQSNFNYTYLALGDSYTIGEGITITDTFPYQTVQLLRQAGYSFHAPEIIAKTGWTTDELLYAIHHYKFQPAYHFVSLLIGVNNQYRGKLADEYAKEFQALLDQAIWFAGKKAGGVFVLSIPDWGITPFAEGRDRAIISAEIDLFNSINQNITEKKGAQYINITESTREAATDESLLAKDKLHPSAKEYAKWAKALSTLIVQSL